MICLDQLSKIWVHTTLRVGESRELVPGLLSLLYTRNTGFAFGFFKKSPNAFQDLFYIGVPIFALVLIVLIFIKLQDNQMLTSVALTTILGGAVGNLIDRAHYGYVIDFIDLHAGKFHLAPLNVADLSIVLGVTMMFIGTVLRDKL